MGFYSAKLFFVELVEGTPPCAKRYFEEVIVVFRAGEYNEAFSKALALGKSKEKSFTNNQGKNARWAFVEILTLDWIGSKVDGKEVHSRISHRVPKSELSFDEIFQPENSEPEGTI